MTVPSLVVDPHPSLRAAWFTTTFPAALGALDTPPAIRALLDADAPAPLARDEAVRAAVRDMLRVGGYKPTGRGKPASEYLVRAAAEGVLAPINLAVDVCNAVSSAGCSMCLLNSGGRAQPCTSQAHALNCLLRSPDPAGVRRPDTWIETTCNGLARAHPGRLAEHCPVCA